MQHLMRPKRFLKWAVEMFGPVALERRERLTRFVEEAVELAHAENMPRDLLGKIVERVYSRKQGFVGKEVGQAQATLELFAESIGLSSDGEAQREWERVRTIPKDEWERRHAAKHALGIAAISEHSRIVATAGDAGSCSIGRCLGNEQRLNNARDRRSSAKVR